MATGLADKALGRASDVRRDIEGALGRGDTKKALYRAIRALQSEMDKLRGWRPADGALTDAELAASVAVIASQLHRHKPRRLPGCPPVPGPDHLLAAFRAAWAHAAGEDQQ